MIGHEDPRTLPLPEVHDRIVTFHLQLAHFWTDVEGWAPETANRILTVARLDLLVELARTLRRHTSSPPEDEAQAWLIFGWTNLGALVEGSLKLLLSVYTEDYLNSDHVRRDRQGEKKSPDTLMLEELRQVVIAEGLLPAWHAWIQRVQQRRNAVHVFRPRELGTLEELRSCVPEYLAFLRDLVGYLPEHGVYASPCEIDYSRLPRPQAF